MAGPDSGEQPQAANVGTESEKSEKENVESEQSAKKKRTRSLIVKFDFKTKK